MKKRTPLICIAFVVALLSCRQEKFMISSANTIKLNPHKAELSADGTGLHAQQWHPVHKHICIIFGYGYNDENFVHTVISQLKIKYGLESEGGLILPLQYPNDFRHSGKGRISSLKEILETKTTGGIIILGAPENTHSILSNMKTEWGGTLPYPVFSFFPQDDLAGMEYVSDFVLENAQAAKMTENAQDEQEAIISKDASELLDAAVRYMKVLTAPLPADQNLHAHVKALVGNIGSVSRYVDPETGLQAINHFVLD